MKESTLASKVHVRVILSVPEICGSHESPNSEKQEAIEQIMEDYMAPQYFRCVKKFLESLKNADIPEKLYHGQEVIVKGFDIDEIAKAFYQIDTKQIYFDANAMILQEADFIFAHELGHKTLYVKSKGLETFGLARDLLELSDLHKLNELLADAFGAIVTGKSLNNVSELPELKQEGLKRLMLRLAWSI